MLGSCSENYRTTHQRQEHTYQNMQNLMWTVMFRLAFTTVWSAGSQGPRSRCVLYSHNYGAYKAQSAKHARAVRVAHRFTRRATNLGIFEVPGWPKAPQRTWLPEVHFSNVLSTERIQQASKLRKVRCDCVKCVRSQCGRSPMRMSTKR